MEVSTYKTPSRSRPNSRGKTTLSRRGVFETKVDNNYGLGDLLSQNNSATDNNKCNKSPVTISGSGSGNQVPISERQQLHQILKQQQLIHAGPKFVQDSENSSGAITVGAEGVEICVTPKSTRKGCEKRNTRGETPLHVACIQGDYKQVKRLIENGCFVNTSDHAGWTPLHEACNRGWYKVARLLIASGAEVNARNRQINQFTPLHDAAVNSHVQIVKLLLRYGADPEAQTNDKKRPIDLTPDPNVIKAILNATTSFANKATGEQSFAETAEEGKDDGQHQYSLLTTPLSPSLSLPGTPHVPIGGGCRRTLFKISGSKILGTEIRYGFEGSMASSEQPQQTDGNVSSSRSVGLSQQSQGQPSQQGNSASTSTGGAVSNTAGSGVGTGDAPSGTPAIPGTSPNNSRSTGSRSTKEDSQTFAACAGLSSGVSSGTSSGTAGVSAAAGDSQGIDGGSANTKGDEIGLVTSSSSVSTVSGTTDDVSVSSASASSGRGNAQDINCQQQQQQDHTSNNSSSRSGSCQGQMILAGNGSDSADGASSGGNSLSVGATKDITTTSAGASGGPNTISTAPAQASGSSSCSQKNNSSEQLQHSEDAAEPMEIGDHPSSKSQFHGAGKKRRKSVDKDNSSPTASTSAAAAPSMSEQATSNRSDRSDRAKAEPLKAAARSPRPKKQKGRKDTDSKGGCDKGEKDDAVIGKCQDTTSAIGGKTDKGSTETKAASGDKGSSDNKCTSDKSGPVSEKGDKAISSSSGGNGGSAGCSGASSSDLGGGVGGVGGSGTGGKGTERGDNNNNGNSNNSSTTNKCNNNNNNTNTNNGSSGSDHEGGDKDSAASGDGLKVPPLKIVLPPMSSATGVEKENNSNDVLTAAPNSAKTKQLPYIVNSPLAGNSPQPASPAASSPLETKEWREESKRVTRSSQRAQIHDSNNNDDDDAPAPSSGKTHPRKRKIRNTRGSAAANSSGQRESSRATGATQNNAASSSGSSGDNRGTNSADKTSASLNEEEALELLPPPEKDYFGEPSTMFNPYEALKNIRRAVDKRRLAQISAELRPKTPLSFKDYLLNKCTYALEGNPASRQEITMASVPSGLSTPLRELFIEQEHERCRLRLQQLMERDKLVLAAEQEILRVNAHEARAVAGQTIPLSVTTVLRDMEIYNTLDPESNLYNPRTGMTAANPLLDNNVKDPSRYNNGRLFKSWLQDTDDKWEREKESLLLRHHSEAEALRAVQTMDWTWKAKECIPTATDSQGDSKGDVKGSGKGTVSSKERGSNNDTDKDTKHNIERDLSLNLNLCVPMVYVSDDFDLLAS